MDICNLSASALTVYISSEELRSKGLAAESLTAEETALLIKDALPETENYLSILEVYPGKDATLVFLFLSALEPAFFRFDSIENVISAAQNCGGEPSSLYFTGGEYVLSVYPWRGAELPPALFEFGTELKAPREYELFLREQGAALIDSSAIESLTTVFK